MKTYKIIHKEELVGWFYVEANSPDEALEEYRYKVDNGKIDFSDMELINSEDVAEEMEE